MCLELKLDIAKWVKKSDEQTHSVLDFNTDLASYPEYGVHKDVFMK